MSNRNCAAILHCINCLKYLLKYQLHQLFYLKYLMDLFYLKYVLKYQLHQLHITSIDNSIWQYYLTELYKLLILYLMYKNMGIYAIQDFISIPRLYICKYNFLISQKLILSFGVMQLRRMLYII